MVEKKTKNIDSWLLCITIMLTCFGIIMVFSSSMVISYKIFNNPYVFLKKQSIFAIIGFILIYILYRIDYKILKKLAAPILLFTLILLLLVFTDLGVTVVGRDTSATRWIKYAGITFQPSEFVKLAIIIFLCSSISVRKEKIKNFASGIFPYLFVIGLVSFIIMLQKSLTTIIIIFSVFFFLLFISGAKLKHLATVVIIGLFSIALLVMFEPYRLKRIFGHIAQNEDIKDKNYQIQQSLIAIGVGGIKGVGPGQSRQKFLFLPHPHTDFIFSIIAEELGLWGTFFLFFLFLAFAAMGFKISTLCTDFFGFLLAGGITFLIIFQVMINISVAIGVLPVTGTPLPFISYGGSSLITTLCGVGILLSISKKIQQTIT